MQVRGYISLVFILNTADYYTTLASLERGHQELNPLMAVLLDNPVNYMLVKIVITTVFLLFAFRWLEKRSIRAVKMACLAITALFVAAVVNNLLLITWW